MRSKQIHFAAVYKPQILQFLSFIYLIEVWRQLVFNS